MISSTRNSLSTDIKYEGFRVADMINEPVTWSRRDTKETVNFRDDFSPLNLATVVVNFSSRLEDEKLEGSFFSFNKGLLGIISRR